MARPAKYDWDNIRLDLEAGQSHEYVRKKYNVEYDVINKHLKRNPLQINQDAKSVIKAFDEVSQSLSQVADKSPELAQNVMDIVTQKHPEFKKAMVALSSKLFNRMLKIADEATANEIPQLAKGMQTITDTLGVSQRHAPKTDINLTNAQQNNIVVEIE